MSLGAGLRMSNFTSLSLDRKKQLLSIFIIQGELINALSEATNISKESLLFSVRSSVYLTVDEMSEQQIEKSIANIEKALQELEKIHAQSN